MVSPLSMLPLGGGAFLGWSLGANDAANVFGTAVGARIVRFRTAALLCSGMVILGAVLQGTEGIETLSSITTQTVHTAVIVSVAAAITSTIMTVLSLPASTSQAVVGAILGIGLATGNTNFTPLLKVAVCWILTPIGSMAIAILVFLAAKAILRRLPMSILTRDKVLRFGLILFGSYGAYALGANNVANTTGMFAGLLDGVDNHMLTAIGGVAIAAGVITYSHRVMLSVGSGIMNMDAFSALVAVLSMSITVHIFALVGVPVSTSQGIVGAILGIGLLRGVHVLRFGLLRRIAIGWFMTPFLGLILSAAGYAIITGTFGAP